MDPTRQFVVVGAVVLLVVAILLKPAVMAGLAFQAAKLGVAVFRWLMVVGLVWGFANSSAFRSVVGWTPTSWLLDLIHSSGPREQGTKVPTKAARRHTTGAE